MLGDLIISRVRVKILVLYFSQPGKRYHVRDIVRLIDEEINAVRRELSHLEKIGLAKKEARGNRLYYELRKDYPLYFELLSLVGKTSFLGGAILKHKPKLGKIKYLFLLQKFLLQGSRKSDDIDLVAIGNLVIPELFRLIKEEEVRRGVEINYTAMTEEEFQFRKKRHDPFISSILRNPRVMIIGNEEELIELH